MIMENSPNQQGSDQDRRKNGTIKDATVMTIEFLRARLLSERSVSRTARQRADELAKRVVELEEQVKMVSLQRKKADEAIADVVAILENHGIRELPEEFYSSSDQEVIQSESKMGNNSPEEEESSGDSKMRRDNMDELSGSELESSPLPGRSLSWKSGKDSSRSRGREKRYMDPTTRRRSTSASTMSDTPRRCIGKSCRQIRRRETRSPIKESKIEHVMLALQNNGVATCSEGSPTRSDIGHDILRVNPEKQDPKIFHRVPVSGDFENQRAVANAGSYLSVHGSDNDMERALDHQAQLIGQYEEEEKAQREWEAKFRENNSGTPDSCEPGNHSDITEERDDTKALPLPCHVWTMTSQHQETKSKVEDVVTKEASKTHSDGFHSPLHVDVGCSQDQKSKSMPIHESPASDFVFPVTTDSGNYSFPAPHSYHHHSCLEGATGNQPAQIVPSPAGSSFKDEISGSKHESYPLIPRETPNKLGSVLEALHEAKLSLKHKVNALPPMNGGSIRKAIEFSSGDRPDVPIGSAGLFRVPSDLLFRLPSDFPFETTTKTNLLDLDSRLALTNYSPNSPFTLPSSIVPTGNRHLAIPSSLHMESRSKIPTWEPLENRSRFSSRNSFLGPCLGTGLPSSSRYALNNPNTDMSFAASGTDLPSTRYAYNNPNMDTGLVSSSTSLPSSTRYAYSDPNTGTGQPSSRRYAYNDPNMIARIPSNEGPRVFSSSGAEMPRANGFSFYDDHIRPSMYR